MQGTWWEYQAHSAAAHAADATTDEVAAEHQNADRLRDVLVGQEQVARTSGLSGAGAGPFEEFVTSSAGYLSSDASLRGEPGVDVSPKELRDGQRAAQAASDTLARATTMQSRAAADTSLQARADFLSARRSTVLLLLVGLAPTLRR